MVGGTDTVNEGVVYEFDVVDNSEQVHSLWGFGIDQILDPPDPVILQPVCHIFPHVFDTLPAKPVDLLVTKLLQFIPIQPCRISL